MVSLPRSAALLLTLLSAGVAHARSFEGTVRERGTRTPIAGAVLFLVEGSDDYDSDEDGQFVVTLDEGNLPANVTLAVESPGYEPLALSLPTPGPRETRKVDLYMTPSAQGDATTRIRDRRSAADRARGMHRISGREVNEMPGTYGDPAKAIETFPGMGRVKRSQGSLLVRGARPSDTAVYVDDFQVPDLYHFTGSTSVINIPFVDSVELVPGAFSARYGRATGGLVVLHTKKLPTDDVHGMAKVDVIDGGAYVGVPLPRNAAVGVSARRSYIDGVRWIQRQNGGAAEDVLLIPTYWDWQLKLDWDVTAGHELVLFAFGSGDREFYVRDGSGAATPYEEIRDSDFARLGLRYSHILGDGLSHSLTPMIGFERRLKDVQAGLERQSRDTFEAQLRDELTWRDEQSRVVIGVDATTQVDLVSFGGLSALPPVWQLPIVDTEGAVRDLHHNATLPRATLGMYGEGTFTPLEGLSFTPGLRLDAYWVNDEPTLSVEPRVAGSYQVLDGAYGFTVRAGGGVFASPPSPEDTAAAARFGRRLESSRALHLQGGFEQLLGNAGAFSTTLFAVERDHVPLRVPSFPSSPEPFASPIAATGSAQSRGVEVLLRLQASAETFGWASYTLARHQLRDGRGLGAESAAYASEVDTTHLVSFVGQTSLGAGFRFGGRYRIATGQPYTPILGGVFDADGGRYLPVYAPRNAARHETFQAVDLRVDWSALLPWLELVLYADLVNAHFLLDGLLGNNATEDFIYSSDYSASSEVKGLPLIPTLGVKATF